MARFIPAHLTLLGPTVVDGDAESGSRIEAHLRQVAAAHTPFELHLHGTGTFQPVTEVVFVAVADGGAECERLATAVRAGPLARELVYPYRPHVTVAHDVAPAALDGILAELAGFDAWFRVDGFTLYTHAATGHWRPLRHFAFRAS
jgi:2'-5' RNA ligase